MRSAKLKFLTFALNAFWRALLPLNLFLFLAAIFQAALLAVLSFGDGIELPKAACEYIKLEAEKLGAEVDFSRADVGVSGILRLDAFRIRAQGTPADFFSAKRVEISFRPLDLLRGKFEIGGLYVDGGKLSPSSGGNLAGLENIRIRLFREGKWWNVLSADFSIASIRAEASGYVSDSFDASNLSGGDLAGLLGLGRGLSSSGGAPLAGPESANRTGADADFFGNAAKKIDAALAKCAEFLKYAGIFADPAVSVEFFLSDGGAAARANLYASSASLDLIGGSKWMSSAELKDINLELDCRNGFGNSARLVLNVGNFSGDGLPSCADLSVGADIFASSAGVYLEDLNAAAKKISYGGSEVSNISVRKSRLSEQEWREDWKVYAALGVFRTGGELSFPEDGGIEFDLSGTLDTDIIFKRAELSGIKELEEFSFPRGIRFRCAGSAAFDGSDARASGSLSASDCTVMRIPAEELSLDLSYDASISELFAKNITVKAREGWRVEGDFLQNFSTNRYFISVRGDLRPMAISHFMEKWWAKVMSSFKFSGEKNFPSADVRVEGTWGAPEKIWCFGEASGRDAVYSGAHFDEFSMSIWVNPDRISIYDISILSSGRRAHGSLEWLYEGGITSYQNQKIFLESELSSGELAALGGRDAKEILDIVKFSSPPRLTLNASLGNPSDPGCRDIFNLEVFAAGTTQVEFARLENLRFHARSDKIFTQIEDASFGFCGGVGEGGLSLEKTASGKMEYDLSVNLENMNQRLFARFLTSLDPGGPPSSAASEENQFVKSGEKGMVNVSMCLTGDTDDMSSAVGYGYAELNNSDLMQLRLLGLLSKALSALKLPSGTFDLTYAKSPFSIADSCVKFPELELGGPMMRIKGAAGYDWEKDDVDATIVVYPFGGISTPIVSEVASLVRPLVSAVQVDLDGPISDPKIGVKVRPANILQSEKKMLEDIREDF